MRRLLISLINFYQMFSSNFVFCKYEVSCSQYTKKMIECEGAIKGLTLGLKRIWSCR
ncbi:TPA: membrane protein insertion efficiency factor YidD [Candidatus Daviesbacteria bacterium]|nr:membrane protein insertion efficiency factor YidD [Candidatus Daviesbacteria bacterium]HCB22190.1 membrane protein insertion efficiency factor YidD [Candidatus Daviesbacteria bacterium]